MKVEQSKVIQGAPYVIKDVARLDSEIRRRNNWACPTYQVCIMWESVPFVTQGVRGHRLRVKARAAQQGWQAALAGAARQGPRMQATAAQQCQQAAPAGDERRAEPGGHQKRAGQQQQTAGDLAVGQRAQRTGATRWAGLQVCGPPCGSGTSHVLLP